MPSRSQVWQSLGWLSSSSSTMSRRACRIWPECGVHHHAFPDLLAAGGDEVVEALHLHDADAAGALQAEVAGGSTGGGCGCPCCPPRPGWSCRPGRGGPCRQCAGPRSSGRSCSSLATKPTRISHHSFNAEDAEFAEEETLGKHLNPVLLVTFALLRALCDLRVEKSKLARLYRIRDGSPRNTSGDKGLHQR